MDQDLINAWQKHMSQNQHISLTDKDKYITSDEIELKIQKHIKPNVKYFKNKTVVDVGCNTGFWLLQFYLHGAKKVIGIEPRKIIVDLFNEFAQKNDLPCKMIQDYHPCIMNFDFHVDCLSIMSFDEEVPDFDDFIYRVGCKFPEVILLIQTTMIDDDINITFPGPKGNDIGKRFKGIVYKFESDNNTHRNGVDPHRLLDECGFQSQGDEHSKYLHHVYSKQYMEYSLSHNGYDIEKIKGMDGILKRPMTRSGKSGKLWWITAKNLNKIEKEPINLFEYNTK